MKNTLIVMTLLLTMSSLYAQKKIKGNGNMTTITRNTSDYDVIKCAGAFDYILVAGTEGNITIEGESNLLAHIITETNGKTLVIKTEDRINLIPSGKKSIKITIPFRDINKVSLAGSGNMWSVDTIKAENFEVALAGSGDIKLKIETSSTKGKVAGSGDLELMGTTGKLDISVSGSGDFEGFGLHANDVEANVAGSGEIELVCNGNLKARVAGSGNIKYKGNPKTEDTKVAGSGKVKHL